MNKHLTDEDLINRLYGIGREDSHLENCEWCHRRWMELQQRRRQLAAPPEIPAEFLAAQRRSIHERLEQVGTGHRRFRLAPVLAFLSVAVLAAVLTKPVPPPPPSVASNDSGLYTEIYSMVENPDPGGTDTIYALVED